MCAASQGSRAVSKPEPWVRAAGYESAEALAGKIEWEGGPADFFMNYTSDDFEGAPFQDALARFRDAYADLLEGLEDAGVVAADEE